MAAHLAELGWSFEHQGHAPEAVARFLMRALFTMFAEERRGEREAEGRPATLSGQIGKIHANLRIGADVAGARPLRANSKISPNGVMLAGDGFIVTPAEAGAVGLGSVPGLERHIWPYRNGRDLTQAKRG